MPASPQPVSRRAHEAVDERGHAERRGDRAGEVEAAGLALGGRQVARREPDERHADRHVDEQAPAPRRPRREHAAEDEPDAAAAGGDRAVGGERAQALAALAERDRQQGERGRRGDRGADALHRAGGEQPALGLREAAGQRGEGEDRDAGDEHPPAAEDVAGAGAEQQQAAERQRVGVLHPRQARGREVQRALDVRQRGDDDRDVEDDHELAGRGGSPARSRWRGWHGARGSAPAQGRSARTS